MRIKSTTCPKCGSTTIYRIPPHREPLSVAYFVVLGMCLPLILPALPSKFRCETCNHFFRRYTPGGWLYLGLLSLFILFPIILGLIYVSLHFLD
jgi:hypothetical protein